MTDKNRLGCQHAKCACGEMKEFKRGKAVEKIFTNMGVSRGDNVDIAVFRRREEK